MSVPKCGLGLAVKLFEVPDLVGTRLHRLFVQRKRVRVRRQCSCRAALSGARQSSSTQTRPKGSTCMGRACPVPMPVRRKRVPIPAQGSESRRRPVHVRHCPYRVRARRAACLCHPVSRAFRRLQPSPARLPCVSLYYTSRVPSYGKRHLPRCPPPPARDSPPPSPLLRPPRSPRRRPPSLLANLHNHLADLPR